MQEEVIKDWRGRIIGFIQTQSNGNAKIFNFYRQLLGTYDKSLNVTKDFYGRIVAKGNQLSMLLNTDK